MVIITGKYGGNKLEVELPNEITFLDNLNRNSSMPARGSELYESVSSKLKENVDTMAKICFDEKWLERRKSMNGKIIYFSVGICGEPQNLVGKCLTAENFMVSGPFEFKDNYSKIIVNQYACPIMISERE
jgi:hypothetical protein